MLDLLNKQNDTSKFITKAEFKRLLDKITALDKIRGPRGRDAVITNKQLSDMKKAMTPILGTDFFNGDSGKNGKDGKDGINGNTITAKEIMGKLKSISGDDRLLIDNIRGGKKLINRIQDLTILANSLGQSNASILDEIALFHEFREKIEGIEILAQQGGSGSCVCPTPPPNTCNLTDPSGAGVEGEHWMNESTNTLFIYMCGQWWSQTVTPFAPPQPEAFLTEDDEVLLTEDDFAIVIE